LGKHSKDRNSVVAFGCTVAFVMPATNRGGLIPEMIANTCFGAVAKSCRRPNRIMSLERIVEMALIFGGSWNNRLASVDPVLSLRRTPRRPNLLAIARK